MKHPSVELDQIRTWECAPGEQAGTEIPEKIVIPVRSCHPSCISSETTTDERVISHESCSTTLACGAIGADDRVEPDERVRCSKRERVRQVGGQMPYGADGRRQQRATGFWHWRLTTGCWRQRLAIGPTSAAATRDGMLATAIPRQGAVDNGLRRDAGEDCLQRSPPVGLARDEQFLSWVAQRICAEMRGLACSSVRPTGRSIACACKEERCARTRGMFHVKHFGCEARPHVRKMRSLERITRAWRGRTARLRAYKDEGRQTPTHFPSVTARPYARAR